MYFYALLVYRSSNINVPYNTIYSVRFGHDEVKYPHESLLQNIADRYLETSDHVDTFLKPIPRQKRQAGC